MLTVNKVKSQIGRIYLHIEKTNISSIKTCIKTAVFRRKSNLIYAAFYLLYLCSVIHSYYVCGILNEAMNKLIARQQNLLF